MFERNVNEYITTYIELLENLIGFTEKSKKQQEKSGDNLLSVF